MNCGDDTVHKMHVPAPMEKNFHVEDTANGMQVTPPLGAQQEGVPVLNRWLQSKQARKGEPLGMYQANVLGFIWNHHSLKICFWTTSKKQISTSPDS